MCWQHRPNIPPGNSVAALCLPVYPLTLALFWRWFYFVLFCFWFFLAVQRHGRHGRHGQHGRYGRHRRHGRHARDAPRCVQRCQSTAIVDLLPIHAASLQPSLISCLYTLGELRANSSWLLQTCLTWCLYAAPSGVARPFACSPHLPVLACVRGSW